MWSLAVANVKDNFSRFVATLIAIALGVSFIATSSMLLGSIQRSLGGEFETAYAAVDAVIVSPSFQDEEGLASPGIPETAVAQVEALPEIQSATRIRKGYTTNVDNRDPTGFGDSVTVRNFTSAPFDILQIVEGNAPKAASETAVDKQTFDTDELSIGDTLNVATPNGAEKLTIVGVTRFGSTDRLDGGGTYSLSDSGVEAFFEDDERIWDEVLLITSDDSSFVDVKRKVEAIVGQDAVSTPDNGEDDIEGPFTIDEGSTYSAVPYLISGDNFRDDLTANTKLFASVLAPILKGFSYLAMFVCVIVIYNTYAVVVAQRRREIALTRAIAATPRQIRRSLRSEGFIIGFIGSILGILLAMGLTSFLAWLINSRNWNLPPASMYITPRIIITGLIIGTLASTIAVLLPAFRGSRTAPVEAMRESAIETKGPSTIRSGIAIALALLGTALIWSKNQWLVGLGSVSFVVSIFVADPLIATLFATILRPVSKIFGMSGALATDNLKRNPKRSATTANALVIGVLLVTIVTAGGSSLEEWAIGEVEEFSASDVIVTTDGTAPLPDEVIRAVGEVDNVKQSVEIQSITAQVTTPQTGTSNPAATPTYEETTVGAAEPAEMVKLGVATTDGSLNNLDGGVAVVAQRGPGTSGYAIGDTVKITTGTSEPVELQVTALLDFSLDIVSAAPYFVEPATMARLTDETVINTILVDAEFGKSETVQEDIGNEVKPFSTVYAIPGNIFATIIESVFSFLITAINALLAMSVIIAGVGIFNTLSLSIFERTQEIGLLRSVGMSRGETRRMVFLESIQIALLGTGIGFGGGLLLVWLLLRAADFGAGLTFDWARLGVVLGVGFATGFIAAIIPTLRVSRINIIDAMRAD